MTNNKIKLQLTEINIKSSQLLKLFEYDINADEDLDVDEILKLQEVREQLISNLFEQYPINEIHQELSLINQMVSVDSDLKVKTKSLKQALANKLIKVKKGKKSALTYKKL